MTPKEKAKELYEKYDFVYIQNYTSKHEVKQCALIAVDEIIDLLWHTHKNETEYRYWQEVRKEVELL